MITSHLLSVLLLAAFAATVPVANWLIGNFGVFCVPDGPCLVPVAPDLVAPSGVLVIGIALVLRDAIHSRLGVRWMFAAVALGGILSFTVAPPALAVASMTAFLISEGFDAAVYARLVERRPALAVLASGIAGAAVDSVVFVSLAFGSLDYVGGQTVGKLWASAAVAAAVWFLGQRRAKADCATPWRRQLVRRRSGLARAGSTPRSPHPPPHARPQRQAGPRPGPSRQSAPRAAPLPRPKPPRG